MCRRLSAAYLHLRARRVWQLDSAAKTLVLLRVIVLQTNLQLDGLLELALLGLRALEDTCRGGAAQASHVLLTRPDCNVRARAHIHGCRRQKRFCFALPVTSLQDQASCESCLTPDALPEGVTGDLGHPDSLRSYPA